MPDKTTKPPKYIWNPYRDGITQSALKLFLVCPEQFRLTYMVGWIPRILSAAIEFGSAFHDCVATVSSRKNRGPKAVFKITTDYEDAVQKESRKMTIEQVDQLHKMVRQIEILLNGYVEFWKEADENCKWAAREKVFSVSVTVPGWNTSGKHFERIDITGRWDGVIEEGKKKNLRLRETKTKAQINEPTIRLNLQNDMQTMLYCHGIAGHFGQEPIGITYDVIRRPQLKQGKKETIDEFIERIKEDIAERPAWYFMRWNVDFAPGDLSKWKKHVLIPVLRRLLVWYDSIVDLSDPWDSPHHYMSDAWATGWGTCPLFELLASKNTFPYYRRKVPFPELED